MTEQRNDMYDAVFWGHYHRPGAVDHSSDPDSYAGGFFLTNIGRVPQGVDVLSTNGGKFVLQAIVDVAGTRETTRAAENKGVKYNTPLYSGSRGFLKSLGQAHDMAYDPLRTLGIMTFDGRFFERGGADMPTDGVVGHCLTAYDSVGKL